MTNNASLALGFEQVCGEAIFDREFVQALSQNPIQTLQSIGIEATEEILDTLRNLDVDSIVAMLETFRTNSRLYQV